MCVVFFSFEHMLQTSFALTADSGRYSQILRPLFLAPNPPVAQTKVVESYTTTRQINENNGFKQRTNECNQQPRVKKTENILSIEN